MCATRSRNALQKIDGLLPRVAHDTEVRHHVEAHDDILELVFAESQILLSPSQNARIKLESRSELL